jgi:hypothetical protein
MKNMLDSCPLGHISNISERSSVGFLPPRGSIWNNFSILSKFVSSWEERSFSFRVE